MTPAPGSRMGKDVVFRKRPKIAAYIGFSIAPPVLSTATTETTYIHSRVQNDGSRERLRAPRPHERNRRVVMLSPDLLTYAAALLLILRPPAPAVAARPYIFGKPAPSEAAATARWLASQNTWGVLSTISSDLGGAPFGNVVSYSDGAPGDGNGIPYFYLTTLDPTARDALEDERTSFTLSEFPLGTCGKIDPENPTCAKLTLTGKLKLVDLQSSEAELAKSALFTKHPEMKDWPKNHHFRIFKLEIENIFLIDWFGGPKPISPSEYLEYERDKGSVKFS